MTRLERVLLRAASDLDRADVPWALVGGLAVSARTEPRFTRDVDLAVSVSGDAEAEALVRDQRADGYVVLATVEHAATARLATVRLQPPGEQAGGVVVDLLFASSGIEPELVAASERIPFTGTMELPVATVGHLIAAKLLAEDDSQRAQDRVDLRALAAVASVADLDEAREAVGLISDRGYDRGRDLRAALAALIATV